MAPSIKATCPECGEVELTAAQVRLMACTNAPLSYYAFDCPACDAEVRKPADKRVVCLLVTGGVVATTWDVPGEAMEAHEGEPLNHDDLLDFVLALASSEYLAALAEF
jgi:hypothetical protein